MSVIFAGLFPSLTGPATGASTAITLALDGSANGGCTNATSSCSATLSTQHGGDIIIAFTIESLDTQVACGFTVVDTANLIWTARSVNLFDQSGRNQMQEFWAETVPLLTADVITESIIGCGNSYNTLLVFAISGVNFNNPFDPNASLPGTATGIGGNTAVQVSTNNSNDMIFGAVSHGNAAANPTPGPGFTLVTTTGLNVAEYEIVNSATTNMAVTFNDSAAADWVSIADAVQAGAPPPPPALNLSPSNGIVGTKVFVHGTGFLQSSSVQTTITFDDQLVGFVAIQSGAFNFTFDVPVAQPGPHTIKAVEQSLTANIIAIATSPFQVLPTPATQSLAVSLSTGTIYFPGDNATIFVIVSLNGKRVTISDLQLTLQVIAPSGSIKGLSTKAVQTGIFVSNFAVPAKNPKNSLGTYIVTVDAFSPTFGNASAATGFEVKPSWLATTVAPLTAGATLVTIGAVIGVAWQKGYFKKNKKGTPELSFE